MVEPDERRALARQNRRLIAERCGWPPGALEECERLDDAHPGWSVYWRADNTTQGFECPAGWRATMPDGPSQRKANGGWESPTTFGLTPAELEERIAAVEERLAAAAAEEERRWRSMRALRPANPDHP